MKNRQPAYRRSMGEIENIHHPKTRVKPEETRKRSPA